MIITLLRRSVANILLPGTCTYTMQILIEYRINAIIILPSWPFIIIIMDLEQGELYSRSKEEAPRDKELGIIILNPIRK